MIAHELTAAAFERSPVGMLVVNSAGTIIAVNRELERMLGYSRNEIVGQNVDLLVPLSRAKGHAAMRESYMDEPSARPMGAGRDLVARHRDGQELPVEIGLSSVEFDGHRFVLCSIVDISVRRQMENHLRQTQKLEAIGTLAGGIAHDFNNILQGIMGYSELLRDAMHDRPDARAEIDAILEMAHRGRDLVARILLFSRKGEPVRSIIRLESIFNEATQLLRATMPQNVEIRMHVDPQTPDVKADPTELHQIIINLVNNAAYAMKQGGGNIDIQTGPVLVDDRTSSSHPALRRGSYARVSVNDTGCGIPAAILDRVFEPFYTTKPVGQGTGLGLSMVHRIVRSLGGSVEVHSREGRGTRFDVFLPTASRIEVDPQAPKSADKVRCRILFVDDEVRLAQLGQRLLAGDGFDVDAYSSSLQALSEFNSNPDRYDLVITDNKMPHLPGIELADAITKIRPDIPILMVSGNGDTIDPNELSRRGVRRLIAKPYTFSDLRTVVMELINKPVV